MSLGSVGGAGSLGATTTTMTFGGDGVGQCDEMSADDGWGQAPAVVVVAAGGVGDLSRRIAPRVAETVGSQRLGSPTRAGAVALPVRMKIC